MEDLTAIRESESTDNQGRTRVKFYPAMDIILLKMVVSCNPYEDSTQWKELLLVMKTHFPSQGFSVRNIRERVEYLLKLHIKDDRANLKKSGTEEEYAERDILLEEVKSLRRDFKFKCSGVKRNQEKKQGEQVREEAASLLPCVSVEDEVVDEIVDESSYTVELISGMDECPLDVEEVLFNESLPDLPCKTSGPLKKNQVHSNDGAGPSSSKSELPSRAKTPKPVFACQRGRLQKAAPTVKKSLTSYMERFDGQNWKLKEKELELKEKELNLREVELELKRKEVENERRKIELEETRFRSWNEQNQATIFALIDMIGKK